jgi:hypothetical protein
LLDNLEADLEGLKEPFAEVDLEMQPGKGIVDGVLVEPPGFVMRMKSAGNQETEWGAGLGPSGSPPLQETSLG